MTNTTTKKKILHVDDEFDTLSVVKTILEKEGYEVVSVNRAEEAISKVRLNGFDLLIFDIMMPDMSGWELFTRIGEIKKDYKVIFLSILEPSDEKITELMKAGVRDYISKPFDRDDFVRRVKKAIDSD